MIGQRYLRLGKSMRKCKTCKCLLLKASKESKKQFANKKYCSVKCMTTRLTKNCAHCKTVIVVKKCRLKKENFCSILCANKFRIGYTPWNKGKGTKSTRNELFRKSKAYIEWREAIYERDDYTCQLCGERGGRLNADHIKPFALFPKLRLELSNGRTLCESCHRKTPTYGWGIKNMHYEKN